MYNYNPKAPVVKYCRLGLTGINIVQGGPKNRTVKKLTTVNSDNIQIESTPGYFLGHPIDDIKKYV